MTRDEVRTIKFRMLFPDRKMIQVLLERLSHHPGVALDLVRGRFSPRKAWCEVEIRGAATKVEKAILICKRCGVAIRALKSHVCPT